MFLTGIEGEGMLYFMGAGLYCGAVSPSESKERKRKEAQCGGNSNSILYQDVHTQNGGLFCLFDNDT